VKRENYNKKIFNSLPDKDLQDWRIFDLRGRGEVPQRALPADTPPLCSRISDYVSSST